MNDTSGSFHVHMEEEPYCQSWSYHNEDTHMRSERAANLRAEETGGVVVGPFDFDWSRCAYRRMMTEEVEQRQKERIAAIEQDDTIPENERSYHPRFKHEVKGRLHSYHVHTDGDGWCRSFDSKRRALDWIRERSKTHTNPRIVGPLRYPAVACKYFHDNVPAYLKG